MIMRRLFTLTILLLLAVGNSVGQFRLGFETGAVFNGYNHLRISSNTGTYLSLTREMEGRPSFHYRFDAEYTIKQRHHILLLYAPLTMKYKGTIDRQVIYTDRVFEPNTPLRAEYKFNSYRLTYRYDIVHRPRLEFALGLSLKIRDAAISLSSDEQYGRKKNLGIVPLINFNLWWHFYDDFGLLFQGDALAAKQGRAEDLLLSLTYLPTERVRLNLGYRMLEGGGDSKEVYTFSMFNYAVVGISYTFGKGSPPIVSKAHRDNPK